MFTYFAASFFVYLCVGVVKMMRMSSKLVKSMQFNHGILILNLEQSRLLHSQLPVATQRRTAYGEYARLFSRIEQRSLGSKFATLGVTPTQFSA